MKKSFGFIKKRIIKASQGVISILLALLLVPFTSIACALLTTARINSAVAIFDEALSNASNSALGTYDSFLKKRFGLLAVEQSYTTDNFINDLFMEYLKVNLGSLSNTYINYTCDANGVFSLADNNILKTQILEFSKYTVPTQIAIDGLNIDGLISSLEKTLGFGSIFSTITKTIDTGTAFLQLGIDYETLKSTAKEYQDAKSNYSSQYRNFSSAVNTFVDEVSAKRSDMNQKQVAMNNAKKNLKDSEVVKINDEIEDLKLQIEEEKAKENPDETLIYELEENLKNKEEQAETLSSEAQKANKSYQNACTEYNKSKQAYDKAVSDNRAAVDTGKTDYLNAIDNVIWWLSEYKSNHKAVQTDLQKVSTSAAGTAIAIAGEINTSSNKDHLKEQKENETQIKDNNDKISKTDDEDLQDELREENEYLQMKNDLTNQEDVSIKNTNTIIDKANSAVQESTKSVNKKITDTSQSFFDTKISELRKLREKVAAFNVENISKKIYYPEYYFNLDNLFATLQEVIDAEADLLSNLVKDSAWTLLKTIINFVKALLNLTVFYVPELDAIIDTDYYDEKKNDVPKSTFDIASDAELSQKYKDLFGDYSAADMDALGAFDVIASIKSIFTQFGVISDKVTGINAIFSILNLGETINAIKDAITTIKDEISSIFNFISNLIAGSGIYQKILISGYATYMTSNRTTFKKSSPLNSASYSMRNNQKIEETSLVEQLANNVKSASLLSAIEMVFPGDGKDKCFKGAETEYLLVGSKNEKTNQFTTFWIIYAVRLVLNLPAVLTNTEVSSIAAATTIFAPLVYIIVLLLEAYADTLLLVNGSDVPLVKMYTVYVSPTGIGKFISKISSLKLTTKELSDIKSELNKSFTSDEMSDAIASFTTDASTTHLDSGQQKSESDFLNFDYTKYMFISMLLFKSEDKLLDGLSEIIQMECIENQINKGNTEPKFNINRSYTYIRTSASFTTNEFIRLSTSDGLFDTKKRIIYRGY